jgi:hypothetical protein
MPRTKHGRAAQAVTLAEVEAQLAEVCVLAKRLTGKKRDEAHDWIDDLLSQWEFVRQMSGPKR